jgi:hypothetical protein
MEKNKLKQHQVMASHRSPSQEEGLNSKKKKNISEIENVLPTDYETCCKLCTTLLRIDMKPLCRSPTA